MKKQIILIATSILLVILLLIPTACVPEKDAGTTAPTNAQLQSRIASLESKVATQAKVATQITSLEAKAATQAEKIATLQSQSSQNLQPVIAQLQSDLVSTNTKIATLQTTISDFQTTISELQAKIIALEVVKVEEEEEAASDVDPEDAIEVDALYPRLTPITVAAGEITIVNLFVKLKLENILNVGIEDVELAVRIDAALPAGLTISSGGLALAGDIDWMYYGGYEFVNLDEIELKANEKDSYTLTLTIRAVNNTPDIIVGDILTTLRFTPEDYELVE